MTILRLPPVLLESYSTVSTLPRSMLLRFLSKPVGAGWVGASVSGRASAREAPRASRRAASRLIAGTSERRDRAQVRYRPTSHRLAAGRAPMARGRPAVNG